MKKFLIGYIFLLCSIIINAQSLSVSSFRLLESDLTANTTGTIEKDQNGEVTALIKVVTTQNGFTFDGGALGVVKTIQKPSEIWVYVPKGLKKITISHPKLGMLRDYYFNIPIESARTYEMVLVSGEVQTIVKQARTSQYVVFQLTPPNAVVELNGELLNTEGGTAVKMVKFGIYDYRVQAPNHFPDAGKVTIDNPEEKKIVTINLKPNYSKVILTVANNAEIWVNGEKKGTGSWVGNLGVGTYEIETKKQSHQSSIITKDIIATDEPLTIQLPSPIPIYGEADICSSPAMADILIDGKKVGQTPLIFSNLLIGEHEIRIVKEGYHSFCDTILLYENETKKIDAVLNTQAENIGNSNSDIDDYLELVDEMPQFPGGPPALFEFISKHRNYPKEAEERGIQGRVICSFIIERDGSVSDVKVVRSVDPLLDKEAARIIGIMPKWTPGKQSGYTVRVKETVPVTFKLKY